MTKTFLQSLTVLGALAISGSAWAATIDARYIGVSGVGATIHSSTTTASGGASAGTIAGEITMEGSNPSDGSVDSGLIGQFAAFCVDIAHWLQNNSTYNVLTSVNAVTDLQIGQDRLDLVQALFNTGYSTTLSASAAAGFQMALWEILYEETGAALDVTSGSGFWVTGSGLTNSDGTGAADLANDLLAGLDGNATGSWKLTFLQANPAGSSQNLVTAAPVPLPAGGLLLLAGLGALAAARRRKAA